MALSLLIVGMVLSGPTVRRESMDSIGAAIEPDAQVEMAPFGGEDSAVLSNLSRGESLDQSIQGKGRQSQSSQGVNLKFGGGSHDDGKTNVETGRNTGAAYSLRPEVVKSEACTQKACHDCREMETCWHGVDAKSLKEAAVAGSWKSTGRWGQKVHVGAKAEVPEGSKETQYGGLALTLPVGSDKRYTFYTAEVYASCPSTGGSQKWKLNIEELTNGKLQIYTDLKTKGQLERMVGADGNDVTFTVPVPGRQSWWDRSRRRRTTAKLILPKTLELPMDGKEEVRIRLAFYLDDRSKETKALCTLSASAVSPHVDQCMIVKECLDELGDGSEAGFKIRNVNEYQLDCLEATPLDEDLEAKCKKWNICMDHSEKKKPLVAFLRAALQKRKDNRGKKRGKPCSHCCKCHAIGFYQPRKSHHWIL